jgi:hypothetical protein
MILPVSEAATSSQAAVDDEDRRVEHKHIPAFRRSHTGP